MLSKTSYHSHDVKGGLYRRTRSCRAKHRPSSSKLLYKIYFIYYKKIYKWSLNFGLPGVSIKMYLPVCLVCASYLINDESLIRICTRTQSHITTTFESHWQFNTSTSDSSVNSFPGNGCTVSAPIDRQDDPTKSSPHNNRSSERFPRSLWSLPYPRRF